MRKLDKLLALFVAAYFEIKFNMICTNVYTYGNFVTSALHKV